MTTALDPQAYCSEEAFRRERDTLFRTGWQFVGLLRDVAEDGAWLCAELSGRSVVVQNFHGSLRAFHNVCAHRQSRLRSVGSCGRGPLQCPYHGWTYNEAGLAIGIPGRREFDQAITDRVTPRLVPWQVETLGAFVFVRARDTGSDLRSSLGDWYPQLSAMAEAAEHVVSTTELTIEANWKLIVENTLENYHVHQVHGETLGKHTLREKEFSFRGPHSRSRFSTETSQRVRRAIDLAFPGRPLVSDEYEHFSLFPNTMFTHVYGAFFMMTRVEPLSPRRSVFHNVIMTTRSLPVSAEAASVRELITDSNVEFILRSYKEDAPICEAVQLGVAETKQTAIFGERELRIPAFQAAYRAALHDA